MIHTDIPDSYTYAGHEKIKLLIRLLRDVDDTVREMAAMALGGIGHPSVEGPLIDGHLTGSNR